MSHNDPVEYLTIVPCDLDDIPAFPPIVSDDRIGGKDAWQVMAFCVILFEQEFRVGLGKEFVLGNEAVVGYVT